MATGYKVDGVDVSQENATWLGSTSSQTLTSAGYYDCVTSVNYVNGGVNVVWTAPFTQVPSVTSGIKVASYSSSIVYEVQWTALTNSGGTFRVNYRDTSQSGEAPTDSVSVMIHAIGN